MDGRFTAEELQKARGAIFDTALDIMYIFDVDTLQILDMNQRGLQQLGYTIEEVRRKDFYDLHAVEERARAIEIVEIYRRDGELHNVRDLHLRRKDGSLIPVEKNGRITKVDGKPVAHWVCRDITERIEAEIEIRKKVEDLEVLKTVALEISSGRDKNELFYTIVSDAVNLLGADAGGIGIFDEEQQTITIPVVYNLPDTLIGISFKLDADIFSRAIHTGQAQRVDHYQDLPFPHKEFAAIGLLATAAVPLKTRGKTVGVLWVCMLKPKRVFAGYDMTLFESIGAQAAVAIDNINLYEEQSFISEVLQRGFLPRKLPALKHTEIGTFYASTTELAVVGGDVYDILKVPNNRVSIVVGDVSGHGVEATTDAAMVKYTLRAMAFQNPEPAPVLTAVNPVVASQLTGGHFITLVYGSYCTDSGQLLLGIAGHPYPLVYSAADNQVTPVIMSDPALGLIPSYEYTQTELTLKPGDVLALYTDGIIELRRDKQFFGTERLGDLLAKYADLPAQGITNEILNEALEFANGHLADDVVLMVIKRT